MKTMKAMLAFVLVAAGCGRGNDDPYEDIKKLRTLGVATCAAQAGTPAASCTHVIAEPSTAATAQVYQLTVFAALPLGQTVDVAEPYTDESPASRYHALANTLQVVGPGAYEDHAAFRVYSVHATVAIPTADILNIPPVPGFATLPYGIHLAGAAGDQKIIGNLVVYPSGAPELTWVAPVVDVATPTQGATVGSGKPDLKATLTNTNAESLRVGWFADDGKITNRRAQNTSWETPAAGAHTLVITARGAKSGSFALKTIDVTVQ